MEESDDDMADNEGAQGKAHEEEEEEEDDEIIESDIELEGETVEPDNDPPQKVVYASFNFIYFIFVCVYMYICVECLFGCRWETLRLRSAMRIAMRRRRRRPKLWKPFRKVVLIMVVKHLMEL